MSGRRFFEERYEAFTRKSGDDDDDGREDVEDAPEDETFSEGVEDEEEDEDESCGQ